MRVNHGRIAGLPSDERGPTFTGTVMADGLLREEGVIVNTVVFPPGARTHWHIHHGGQILFVTHGRGWVANADGDSSPITAGDVVWFPPGELHWHGAAPDSYMTHTAISLGTSGWRDAVTEEQYAVARPSAEDDGARS